MRVDPRSVLVILAGFVIAIAVHEFSHALVARLLGDRTAQRAGRLTLNPIKHLDPFGSLMIVMTVLNGGRGFGWGKPVPVNPAALRFGGPGMALVSAAGPASNFLLSVLVLLALPALDRVNWLTADDVVRFYLLNVVLCAFNLLPIPPLDGFGVALGVLPAPLARPIAQIGRYGPVILLILVFSGYYLPVSPLQLILEPVIDVLVAISRRITGVI